MAAQISVHGDERVASIYFARSNPTRSLGCQDSNLEMPFPKTPFEMSREFRLISEHIGTGDFSRVPCIKGEKHPPAALVTVSWMQIRLYPIILEIELWKCFSKLRAASCVCSCPNQDLPPADGMSPWVIAEISPQFLKARAAGFNNPKSAVRPAQDAVAYR